MEDVRPSSSDLVVAGDGGVGEVPVGPVHPVLQAVQTDGLTERGEMGGHCPVVGAVQVSGGERVESEVHPVDSGPH